MQHPMRDVLDWLGHEIGESSGSTLSYDQTSALYVNGIGNDTMAFATMTKVYVTKANTS